MINYQTKRKNSGYALISILVFASISIIILTGLTSWTAINYKAASQTVDREKAFQIAEAGIEYYRWHLAHNPTDFKDGSTGNGPYIHSYSDKMGNNIGQFQLTITAPAVGSTVVKIVSKGTTANTSISRTIEAIMAKPSLAKYAFAANDFMRFGQGTEVFGPINSTQGIRFDGISHNLVTSALSNFDDPDPGHTTNCNEWGVHTHMASSGSINNGGLSNECYSSSGQPPVRSDVFMSGRQLSVPGVDWTGFTQNLAGMKALGQSADGFYKGSSGKSGYKVVLKTDKTFDLYKVTKIKTDCSDEWTIDTVSSATNYAIPSNGVIFLEDNVWVEGQINGSRVTIVADTVGTPRSITVNNDLLYSDYTGKDVIGLMAQQDINVGLESKDTLEIDAALVAVSGRVGRYYYDSGCSSTYYKRSKIHLYGAIATAIRYGFAYVSGSTNVSGYTTREIVYDGNLLYGPPPSFPLTSDQYTTISWREI